VYELEGLSGETKLFGSERMSDRIGQEVLNLQHRGRHVDWRFGDWDAEILLLMQDAAPHDGIRDRVGTHPDPFSARNFIEEPRAGGAQTNRNLHELASHLACRKLAGSAFAGILKGKDDYSGSVEKLEECPWVRGYCIRVLRWVLDRKTTKHLKVVVCLGVTAADFVSEALAIDESEAELLRRERGGAIRAGHLLVSHLWHPSRWPNGRYWPPGGRKAAEAGWRRMAQACGLPWDE
jgi:hypothetical protein